VTDAHCYDGVRSNSDVTTGVNCGLEHAAGQGNRKANHSRNKYKTRQAM